MGSCERCEKGLGARWYVDIESGDVMSLVGRDPIRGQMILWYLKKPV